VVQTSVGAAKDPSNLKPAEVDSLEQATAIYE